MTARPGILCAGRLYCDLIFSDTPRMPSLGTEVFAGGLGLHAGGGAYITGAYFAALGHPCALSAYLPADPFRDLVAAEIAAAGLDLTLCPPAAAGLDPQVTVATLSGGDRAFLTRRAGPPMPEISAEDIISAGARHVHVGELATLVERPGLIAAARAAGATLSLDCSWDETLEVAGIVELVAAVDVFLPNAVEASHLAALGLSGPMSTLTVVKRGAEGASALTGGREYRAPALPVEVVDTTGAGDAFNAGFLSAWLEGASVPACLSAGNVLGARAISGRGGFQPAQGDAPAVAGSMA